MKWFLNKRVCGNTNIRVGRVCVEKSIAVCSERCDINPVVWLKLRCNGS